MKSHPKAYRAQFAEFDPPTHRWADQRRRTCAAPRAQLIQGRSIIQNALIASVPRMRPQVWVSDERILQAGLARAPLAQVYPVNVNLCLIKLPARLFWRIKARTPAWDAMIRQRRRERTARKQAERVAPTALAPLEFTITDPGGRP
ncbi:hypothetical protein MF271_19455 (plasmid) [Deinococcus sp. KNUC1210]|uniref:hypothetical protein n=1 Tax=Deinococcus sp. KNUC1210 TaxID=2917691 RepID=UPI001EF02273|nr:hypothetical protein [Deinococcus sp. KNUC1210]ULH17369.1 hypothetical protein MF271_19455 [Deinococcus sp. KNUC1210]